MDPKDLRRISYVRRCVADGTLKERRLAWQISVRELAQALNVSASTLSRWENCRSVPRADAALRWADAVGV